MEKENKSTPTNHDIPHDHASETTNDQGEVAELHTKVEELNDQLLRTLAENQNLRRRSQKEIEDAHQYAIGKFAADLLTVADNFDRALVLIPEELKEDEKFKNFILGIELTEKELTKVFEAHKIQKHSPLNEKFDHNLHQALFDIPSEEAESGTILQVVQPGYTLKDRLLRPAMVGVASKKS